MRKPSQSQKFLERTDELRNAAAGASSRNNERPKPPSIDFSGWTKTIKEVKEISEDEVTNNQIIFFLMGPSGSGKSSFIHRATSQHYNGVSHSLDRRLGTQKIRTIKCSWTGSGKDVIFVDTPGFDGEGKGVSPEEVLKMISTWLATVHKNGVRVDYLLYLADVAAPISGTPLHNIHMFEKVCGEGCYNKVTLIASRCEEGGRTYEDDFKTFSCAMIAGGAKSARFLDTEDSAFGIIKDSVQQPNKGDPLLLQSELAHGRKYSKTQAGLHVARVFPRAQKSMGERFSGLFSGKKK